MKNGVLFWILLIFSNSVFSQTHHVIDGTPSDSSTYRLNDLPPSFYRIDSTTNTLWMIGNTNKPFFTDSTSEIALMTDTLQSYSVNANNSVTIRLPLTYNLIFDFWHRFQTTRYTDGGIVEFSYDYGATWQNIIGPCNTNNSWGVGLKTDGFYGSTDTLFDGESGFSGTSSGSQYSRIQIFMGYPVTPPGDSTYHCVYPYDTLYLRCRFISDSVADNLAGWIIDSIKFEQDYYGSSVSHLNKQKLKCTYPNPSSDGIFHFPKLENEEKYKIEILNSLGANVIHVPYQNEINLSGFAKGIYFYRVSDGKEQYTGQLIAE